MNRILALTIMLMLCGCAGQTIVSPPKPSFRFWRGYIKKSLSEKEFVTKLNKDFFSLFPESVPYGLTSYNPVILKSAHGPNEYALVAYQDQKSYENFKESAVGKKAAAAHWDVFEKVISKSTVPEIFEGKLELNHAYDLNPETTVTGKQNAFFTLHSFDHALTPSDLIKIATHVQAPQKNKTLILVLEKEIAEYSFSDNSKHDELRLNGNAETILLRKGTPGKDWIKRGEGLDSVLH